MSLFRSGFKTSQINFSIVIPNYNRPRQLSECLKGLARLEYAKDQFEVIVVDDGSHTPPETVVDSYDHRLDVTLITQSNAGPAAARNTGAANARGHFLAFTDDDCVVDAKWLKRLAARFSESPACAVGGRTLNALPERLFPCTSQLLMDYLYAHYNADPRNARFLATNNLALPTDRFHAVGGFDEEYARAAGEDREFCDAWIHHGYRMVYAPEVLVFHAHKLSALTFLRQQFNYGMGAFRFHRKETGRSLGATQRKPPLSFYTNLLSYPMVRSGGRNRFLVMVMFLMSQVGIAAGYLTSMLHEKGSKKCGNNYGLSAR